MSFIVAAHNFALNYLRNNIIGKQLMGASQPRPVQFNKEPLHSTHPFFEKSWIVREQTRTYLQSSYPVEDHYYQLWRARVSKAAGYPNSNFALLPLDLGYVENNETCAKYGYALVNYPDYPYNLAEQIKRRQAESLFFKEKELFYLLYALVAVKVDAKQRGETVGDIRPANVFISRDQNIKVALLDSFPYDKTNYAKALATLKNVLLAPEDLLSASQKQLDNAANLKSQIFSIGATVLSAGLLSDLADLYDYPTWTFSKERHSANTIKWLEQKQYSEIFKSIVLNLLSPEPEKRISLEDLWKFLSKYQSSILAKEQFLVVNPPESLQLGVSIIRSKVQS